MAFICSTVDQHGNVTNTDRVIPDPIDQKLNTLLRMLNNISDDLQELHIEITGYIRPKSERCRRCSSQRDLYRVECTICHAFNACKMCLEKSKCKYECPTKQCGGKLKRTYKMEI